MNLYIRFFKDEVLAHSVDEAVDFLSGLDLGDFKLDDDFRAGLETFMNTENVYPKRYKVRQNIYFTVIRTDKETLEDFTAGHESPRQEGSVLNKSLFDDEGESPAKRRARLNKIYDVQPGWYDMTLTFKRVLSIPGTGKFQYRDDSIRVCCTAKSGIDCYNRVIAYLRSREDIDQRSQFPSVKGNNVVYTYLGEELPAGYVASIS